MAVDMTRLLRGLVDYNRTLVRHNDRVQEAFTTLEGSLKRLQAVYEGAAARAFKSRFDRTQKALNDYIKGATAIHKVLEERIEHLKRADQQEIL